MTTPLLGCLNGAIQASLSVLLVIFYGVLAAQYNLLDNKSAKKISQLSVKLFLPCLLITKVGRELSPDILFNYIPILSDATLILQGLTASSVWAVIYNAVSMFIGLACVRLFKFPRLVTPAVMFNNSTSLPLLLVQSMESTGILDDILKPGQSSHDAIARAQSYFLVNAVVSNCTTFAVGPMLLNGPKRRVYDELQDDVSDGEISSDGDLAQTSEESAAQVTVRRPPTSRLDTTETDERTSLLPKQVTALEARVVRQAYDRTHSILHKVRLHPDDLSHGTRSFLSIIFSFLNAPLLGALTGLVLGIVPQLQRWFFADSHDGGIFTAWLTQSISNTGELFVTLQVVIVGVTLSSSLRKLKRGEVGQESGQITWSAMGFVFLVRYVFWPAVGIPIIYAVARTGAILDNDPILWFVMCLMPCGPPAMKLVPMADVSGTDEGVKMSVAKLLTGMYGVSPVLSLVVVAALKVCQMAFENQ